MSKLKITAYVLVCFFSLFGIYSFGASLLPDSIQFEKEIDKLSRAEVIKQAEYNKIKAELETIQTEKFHKKCLYIQYKQKENLPIVDASLIETCKPFLSAQL